MRQRKKAHEYLPVWESLPKNEYGQVHESDIRDDEWEAIKGYMPFPAKTGRPRTNDRHVINGIMYILSTGIRWNDMPKYYPSDSVCWSRLKEYEELGI